MYSKFTDYELLKTMVDAGYSIGLIRKWLGTGEKFALKLLKRYKLVPDYYTIADMTPDHSRGYKYAMTVFTYEDFLEHRKTENRESMKQLSKRLNLDYYNLKYIYYHIYKKRYDGKITV